MKSSFDALKEFNGQKYSGMPVGGEHDWDYRNGHWTEQKVSPDEWRIHFTASKHRRVSAPKGSGAAAGTEYHWKIFADQTVRKVDEDTYETEMIGVKYRIGYKKPYWRKPSYEYPGQQTLLEKEINYHKKELEKLEAKKKEQEAKER